MLNLHQVKEEICDIGRRLYNKGFAAANDGNISYRIDENRVVCTPTQICKGFMKPDDLCIVDMEGNQISGYRKRTSEIFLHLTIMKEREDVKSVVHCHPPYATAFGVAREAVPQCVLPEVDIYMGDIPIAKYAIPGGQDFADTVLPFIHKSDIIIQANHGTVSYGATVEKAYWLTELLDAYCRILLIARSLGNVGYFSKDEAEALLQLKQKWGFKDPRASVENCELCANDIFRESWKETGVGHRAFNPPTFRRNDPNPEPTSCGCVSNPGLAQDVPLGSSSAGSAQNSVNVGQTYTGQNFGTQNNSNQGNFSQGNSSQGNYSAGQPNFNAGQGNAGGANISGTNVHGEIDQDALVKAIADRVLAALKSR